MKSGTKETKVEAKVKALGQAKEGRKVVLRGKAKRVPRKLLDVWSKAPQRTSVADKYSDGHCKG